MLALDGVETCYGLSQVLFGVSLAIAPGEMVTLMGRNGMGKTTTVRSIMGLTPARAGAIRFMGDEIRSLPIIQGRAARHRSRAGRPPDLPEPHRCARICWRPPSSAMAKVGRSPRCTQLFPRLAERDDSMGNQLSGGEQQMLAIGRALMTNPRLLDPRRGDRRPGAADPRRNLALPGAACKDQACRSW